MHVSLLPWWNATYAELHRFPVVLHIVYAALLLVFLFVVIALCEAAAHRDMARYRSANFRTDLLYALIYQGGLYSLAISAPVLAFLSQRLPHWTPHVLERLPTVVGFFVYWLIADAIGYWIHRLQHASPLLWRFHSVHHSQTVMTFATSYRNHVLEQLVVNVTMYVPLMLLGAPVFFWLPLFLAQNFFEAIQHADLNWSWGRLYPVLVSPAFHAIHHAPERHRHDSNYGKLLSVWDVLFGTLSKGARPTRFGVQDIEMPAGFVASMVAPFRSRPRVVSASERTPAV